MARLSFYLMLAFSCLYFAGAMDVEQGRANHMDLARRATTRKATPTHHKTASKHKTTHKATATKKSTKTKAAKATKKAKKTKTKKAAKHKATKKPAKASKTKASATAKSTTPLTLVSYANYSYASTPQEFYKLWRLKCIHIVGPRSMHHVIKVKDIGNQKAWVYCHGVPAVPGTDAKYSSKNPYSKTCPNGPQTDVTDEEIRKLGVKRVGALGTLVQAKGC